MKNKNENSLPASATHQDYVANLSQRHRSGAIWRGIFQVSTAIGIVVLFLLLWNISNSVFGYAVIVNAIEPEDLAINDIPLEQLHPVDLTFILQENLSANVFRRYETEKPFAERSRNEIYDLVIERVVEPRVEEMWSLSDSLFRRDEIFALQLATARHFGLRAATGSSPPPPHHSHTPPINQFRQLGGQTQCPWRWW